MEIAEQRHLLRTPIEEQAIRDAWSERNRDPRVIAANRHANRTAVQAQGIRDAWSKHNQEISNIQSTANNVLKLAKDYGEVDYSQLESLVSAGKVNGLQSAYKDVGQQILAAKKFEQSISDIIPDAHDWHKQFTSAELQSAHTAIQSKLDSIAHKTAQQQIDQLANVEIKFFTENWIMKSKGVPSQTAIPTWKVAVASYAQKVDELQTQIFFEDAASKLATFKAYKTKSSLFKDMVTKLDVTIAKGDKAATTSLLADLETKHDALEKRRSKTATKSLRDVVFDKECFTDARKSAARKLLADSATKAEADFLENAKTVYATATKDMKAAAEAYALASGSITKMLRGINGYLEGSYSYAVSSAKHIDNMTAMISGHVMDRDVILLRDERLAFLKLKSGGFDFDAVEKSIKDYRSKLTKKYARKYGSTTGHESEIDAKCEKYQLWRERNVVGRSGVDMSFLSCGTHSNHHFSGTGGDCPDGCTPKARIEIFCPKGTQMMYAAPFNHYNSKVCGSDGYWDGKSPTLHISEAEAILQRGGEYRIVEAHFKYDDYSHQYRWFVKMELMAQRYVETDGFESVGYMGYKMKFKK